MLEVDLAAMRRLVEELDFLPLFVTVSGAHLYGFPSWDSDVDLRGCHQLPLRDVVGLDLPNQTREHKTVHDGTEVELVSHEIGRYLRLLVRNNGYILEQISSPIVVLGQEFLDELIARKVGGENTSVGGLDWPFHEARLAELEVHLDRAFAESPLPEDRDRTAIGEFLVARRLGQQ